MFAVGLAAAALLVLVAWQRYGTIETMEPRRFWEARMLDGIATAIEQFRQEEGRLPATLTELNGSDDTSEMLDHWGRPYHYVPRDDGTFELMSLGEDGAVGGVLWDRDLVARAQSGPPERVPLASFLARLGNPGGFWLMVILTGAFVFITARQSLSPVAGEKYWPRGIAGVIVAVVTLLVAAFLIALHVIPSGH